MSHEHHFLTRLDRLSTPHVELALELYRDHQLLGFLLALAAVPEAAERVAVSLDDPRDGPFLVVTREGRFVTCLGKGMRTGDLPVVTRAQLDGAIARATDYRAKQAERRRLLGTGTGARELFRRVYRGADDVSAEDMRALSAFQPIVAVKCLGLCADMAVDVAEGTDRILGLLRRTERPRPHTFPMLRAYWQGFWAVGHLAVLACMGGATSFEDYPQLPEQCCRAVTATTIAYDSLRLAQLGLWSVAKLGKPALGMYKQLYDTATHRTALLEAGLAMAAIGMRHSKLRAEVRKAVSPSPPKAHPELAEDAKTLSRNVEKVFEEPETFIEVQRTFGADMLVRAAPLLSPGSSYRFERVEDVPEDMALRFALHDRFGVPGRLDRVQYLFVCLPWLARAQAENLYLPEEVVEAIRRPWNAGETIALLRKWIDAPRELRTAGPEGPARKGPCPCGSGKKYKRCCEAPG